MAVKQIPDGFRRTAGGMLVPTKETLIARRLDVETGPYYPHNVNGENEMHLAEWAWKNQKSIMLRGPPGCGKTTFAMWFAKEKKAGFYRVACNQDTGKGDFFGRITPMGDEFQVSWGPVMEGIASGNALILLDDANLADRNVVASLYSALDSRIVTDPVSQESFRVPKDVMLVFAMNTGGLYTTMETSPALTRRNSVDVRFDHLPQDRAVKMLLERIAKKEAANPVVKRLAGDIANGLWEGTDALRQTFRQNGNASAKGQGVVLQFKEVPGDGLLINVMEMIMAGIKPLVAVKVGMVNQIISDLARDAEQIAEASVQIVKGKLPPEILK